jgi:hypothetical protein
VACRVRTAVALAGVANEKGALHHLSGRHAAATDLPPCPQTLETERQSGVERSVEPRQISLRIVGPAGFRAPQDALSSRRVVALPGPPADGGYRVLPSGCSAARHRTVSPGQAPTTATTDRMTGLRLGAAARASAPNACYERSPPCSSATRGGRQCPGTFVRVSPRPSLPTPRVCSPALAPAAERDGCSDRRVRLAEPAAGIAEESQPTCHA